MIISGFQNPSNPLSAEAHRAGGIPTPSTNLATMEPMITFAFIITGTRRASFVNHTRMFPSLTKIPWKGIMAKTHSASTSPHGPFTFSTASICTSIR